MWLIIVKDIQSEWLKGNDIGYESKLLVKENDIQQYIQEVFSEYVQTHYKSSEGLSFTLKSTNNLSKRFTNNLLTIKKFGKTVITYNTKWIIEYNSDELITTL